MTSTKPIDMLPIVLKQDQKEKDSNHVDYDDDDDDIDKDNDTESSLLQPLLFDKKNLTCNDDNNDNDNDDDDDAADNSKDPDFLRLNSMVRHVYFSHLHKSIINNYKTCCNNNELTNYDLKKITNELELQAVKLSLHSNYYRKEMLKIINCVKDNTNNNKIHDKLNVFINKTPTSVDVGVQTIDDYLHNDEKFIDNEIKPKTPIETIKNKLDDNDDKNKINSSNDNLEIELEHQVPTVEIDDKNKKEIKDIDTNILEIFGDLNDTAKSYNEDDNSKDSLMQHMEDMFCESEDSNDLLSMIDKNSTTKNFNVSSSLINDSSKISSDLLSTKSLNNNETQNKRKLTLSGYKNMKKRALQNDINEDKQTKKKSGIWFVERIHQVTKLRDKMLNISIKNYRKHGRLKEKFIELFGNDDDADEMMPESPVHIEEHLTSCKERIAPWVVCHLMPYYSKKIIDNRLLFKLVAKRIVDVLILQNTFPEEENVIEYINKYFQNKSFIKTANDIYI